MSCHNLAPQGGVCITYRTLVGVILQCVILYFAVRIPVHFVLVDFPSLWLFREVGVDNEELDIFWRRGVLSALVHQRGILPSPRTYKSGEVCMA